MLEIFTERFLKILETLLNYMKNVEFFDEFPDISLEKILENQAIHLFPRKERQLLLL